MSGSTTTIVASTLPVSVLCSATTHPEGVDPYSVTIVGQRDPGAVHGTGITYDVDLAAFNEWMTANPALVDTVRPVTQAEVDAMQDTQDEYGFELGLEDDTGGALAEDTPLDAARAAAQVAAQRVRQADAQIRQAEILRKQADAQTEAASAERNAAQHAQQQAMSIVERRQQERPMPPPAAAAPPPGQPAQHPAQPAQPVQQPPQPYPTQHPA